MSPWLLVECNNHYTLQTTTLAMWQLKILVICVTIYFHLAAALFQNLKINIFLLAFDRLFCYTNVQNHEQVSDKRNPFNVV